MHAPLFRKTQDRLDFVTGLSSLVLLVCALERLGITVTHCTLHLTARACLWLMAYSA